MDKLYGITGFILLPFILIWDMWNARKGEDMASVLINKLRLEEENK